MPRPLLPLATPRAAPRGDAGALARFVARAFALARAARRPVEARLIDAQRRRDGLYPPERLAEIQATGGSQVWVPLTAVKCRAAEAWLRDTLTGLGERPWALEPSPVPELPRPVLTRLAHRLRDRLAAAGMSPAAAMRAMLAEPEAVRRGLQRDAEDAARAAADRLARLVEDRLAEGGFTRALIAFTADLVTHPAAILKGPVLRRRRRLGWQEGGEGAPRPEARCEVVPEVERVSPFDMFPAPEADSVEAGWLIQRHRLTRADVAALAGVPGFEAAAIAAVLADWERLADDDAPPGLAALQERPLPHPAGPEDPDRPVTALEFWGSVPQRLFAAWSGASATDPEAELDITLWVVGEHVLRAAPNPDPLGRKPYSVASFERVAGSWWGRGLPELIAADQDIVNATARALVNNLAIASGPQVAVDVARLAEGEDPRALTPWRTWLYSGRGGGDGPGISFFQPEANAGPLLAVIERFLRQADDDSGVPSYSYGDGALAGGAGRTATGLAMLMSGAARGLRQVLRNIDIDALQPLIERLRDHVLLTEPPPAGLTGFGLPPGDLQVVPRGSDRLLVREQQLLRRIELAQLTNNPVDLEIMGLKGRAELLRPILASLDLPTDRLIPDEVAAVAPPSGSGIARA